MADEAQRGLDWREEYKRGGTAVGVARARDIINRADLSDSTIGRMVSYFARHEVDKKGSGFYPGQDGYPSAGRIAWALWGGDPGKSWANREWDKIQSKKAKPGEIKVGDFVRWNSSGGTARGEVERIERDGSISVPDSSFTITGTEDDPAALIRVYRQTADGYEPTDRRVGHKLSTLTKIDKGSKMSGHKQIALADVEFKFMSEERGSFKGYASVFDGLDSYNDRIERGAYSDVIEGVERGMMGMPKMFVNHRSWNVPVGKWTKMYEDEKGLVVEGELTRGNPEADVIKAALLHGTVDGLSIGFRIGDYEMIKAEDGTMVRVIKEVAELPEVSIVTFPADEMARVDLSSVKSALDNIEDIKQFEAFLRDAAGFSRGLATATVGRMKRILAKQSDRGEPGAIELPEDLQRQIVANLILSQSI
jgi:hypothetical protein